MQDDLHKLVRKQVEVVAHGGITYRGQLIEASEDTVYLKGDTGWITVPMERVIAIHAEGTVAEKLHEREIDPSFFRFK